MAWTRRYGIPTKQYMAGERNEMHEERLDGKNNSNILGKSEQQEE